MFWHTYNGRQIQSAESKLVLFLAPLLQISISITFFFFFFTGPTLHLEISPKRFTMATVQHCFLCPSRPTALWLSATLNEWLYLYTASSTIHQSGYCTRTHTHTHQQTHDRQTYNPSTHTSRQSLHTQATNLEGKILTHKQPRGTVWINTFYSAYHTVCLSTHLFIFSSSLQIQQTRNSSVDLLSFSENKTIIICTWGCIFGGVYVPCIYMQPGRCYHRWFWSCLLNTN